MDTEYSIADSKIYWTWRKETSAIAMELIETAIQKYKGDSHLYALVKSLVKRRKHRPSTRAAMVRCAFESVSSADWKKVAPLAAASELEMLSLYHLNHLLDHKGGELYGSLDEKIVAAGLTRGVATELFVNSIKNHAEAGLLIYDFERIDIAVHEGWYVDLLQLNWDALSLSENDFMTLYEKRCELMNGELFAISSSMATKIAGASDEDQADFRQIGKYYGIINQMVNDIGDFVPPEQSGETVGKLADDAYSDLYNGRLTLPIFLAWNKGSRRTKELINKAQNNNFHLSDAMELTKCMIKDGVFTDCRSVISDYAKKADLHKRKFSKESFIENIFLMAEGNRYFSIIENIK